MGKKKQEDIFPLIKDKKAWTRNGEIEGKVDIKK